MTAPQRDEDARVAGLRIAAERLLDRLGVAVRPRATVAADLVGDRLVRLAQQAAALGEGPGAWPPPSASANSSSTAAATCRTSWEPSTVSVLRGAPRLPFDRLAEQVQRRRARRHALVGQGRSLELASAATTRPGNVPAILDDNAQAGSVDPSATTRASRAGPRDRRSPWPTFAVQRPLKHLLWRRPRPAPFGRHRLPARGRPRCRRAARGRGAARSGCRRRTSAARTGGRSAWRRSTAARWPADPQHVP